MKEIIATLNDKRFLQWALRFHRYPRYFIDIYNNVIFKALLKKNGYVLGHNIWFHGKPIIKNAKCASIEIGNGCLLCSRSENTALGVNHPIVIRTMRTGAKIAIGNNVRMSGVSICAADSVEIGNNVVIGANAVLTDTDFHSIDSEQRGKKNQAMDLKNARFAPIKIESDVFIGANSAILKGVTVGHCAVVGFGSIVTKSIPPYSIVAGNPARQIGDVRKRTLIKNNYGKMQIRK